MRVNENQVLNVMRPVGKPMKWHGGTVAQCLTAPGS